LIADRGVWFNYYTTTRPRKHSEYILYWPNPQTCIDLKESRKLISAHNPDFVIRHYVVVSYNVQLKSKVKLKRNKNRYIDFLCFGICGHEYVVLRLGKKNLTQKHCSLKPIFNIDLKF